MNLSSIQVGDKLQLVSSIETNYNIVHDIRSTCRLLNNIYLEEINTFYCYYSYIHRRFSKVKAQNRNTKGRYDCLKLTEGLFP